MNRACRGTTTRLAPQEQYPQTPDSAKTITIARTSISGTWNDSSDVRGMGMSEYLDQIVEGRSVCVA